MRVAIEGMGVVSPLGNGVENLKQAVLNTLCKNPAVSLKTRTDTEALKNYLPVRALRRVDHFTRMTLLAAYQAVEDAGLSLDDMKNTGIVLATGYGPARLTFDFLDSIIDYGPKMASPLAFSHSVHNIPAATVALNMQINGPCFTVSQFETSVAAAFLTAQTWMAEGRVQRVLVGAVDESTELLKKNSTRIADGLSQEASGGRRNHAPGEGAVFFCLHSDISRARHGVITSINLSREEPEISSDMPVFFSGAAGQKRRSAWPFSHYNFSTIYGTLPTAMAFDLALATYAVQGTLAPHLTPDNVCCLSRDSFGTQGSLTVTSQKAR